MKGKIITLLFGTALLLSACGSITTTTNQNIGTVQTEESASQSSSEETKQEEIRLAKVGEYVEGDTWKISLLDAKQYDSIGDEYFQTTPEVDGNKFLVLFFEVENISTQDDHFNMFYMESYADGYAIDQTLLFNNPENYDALGGDVAAGKKMKGYVAYEVSSDWKELEFSYKNWIANSNKVATFLITPEQLSE